MTTRELNGWHGLRPEVKPAGSRLHRRLSLAKVQTVGKF